jgi:hypothetical protein
MSIHESKLFHRPSRLFWPSPYDRLLDLVIAMERRLFRWRLYLECKAFPK